MHILLLHVYTCVYTHITVLSRYVRTYVYMYYIMYVYYNYSFDDDDIINDDDDYDNCDEEVETNDNTEENDGNDLLNSLVDECSDKDGKLVIMFGFWIVRPIS